MLSGLLVARLPRKLIGQHGARARLVEPDVLRFDVAVDEPRPWAWQSAATSWAKKRWQHANGTTEEPPWMSSCDAFASRRVSCISM